MTKPFDWASWRLKKRWTWYTQDHDGKRPIISAREPQHWLTYEQAMKAKPGSNIGFGFLESDGLVGIDLDGCITNGVISATAQRILDMTGNSYAEVSQSGRGIKLWVMGTKPILQCNFHIEGQPVEVYNKGKWFMHTGKALKGRASHLERCQPALDWIASFAEKKRPAPSTPVCGTSDEAAVYIAQNHMPSISGKGGHTNTFRLAMRVLNRTKCPLKAFDILKLHHNPQCQPSWSDRELRHKVDSAWELICKGR